VSSYEKATTDGALYDSLFQRQAEILFMSSVRLDEPIAWYGPIVMNSEEELYQAFKELNEGTFIKKEEKYDTI
jgi:redox-sensitive bicupin YhaK (pirin superfamily)